MTCAVGEMAKLLDFPASTLGQYDKEGRYHNTVPPHTRHAYGVPPSPRRGFFRPHPSGHDALAPSPGRGVFYAFSKALATSFSSCRMGRC